MKDCSRCSYVWEPRKSDPKACPRCKVRLDYFPKKSVEEGTIIIQD